MSNIQVDFSCNMNGFLADMLTGLQEDFYPITYTINNNGKKIHLKMHS